MEDSSTSRLFFPQTFTLKIYFVADKWDAAAHRAGSAKPQNIFTDVFFPEWARRGVFFFTLSLVNLLLKMPHVCLTWPFAFYLLGFFPKGKSIF